MSAAAPDSLLSWLRTVVPLCWPGAYPKAVRQLRGDASARRYWRVYLEPGVSGAPASVVAAHLGPYDLPAYARALKLLPEPVPEPLYLNVGQYLKALGVSIPEVYYANGVQPACPGDESLSNNALDAVTASRLILVEDVGDVSLIDAAKANPARTAELFQLAIDELTRFHVDGTARRDSRCLAFSIAYDERLFAWEMEQFLEEGLASVSTKADRMEVAREVAVLAARLGGLSRVLSHRDYHGYNLFIQHGNRLRVLDFQDALLAPAAQDLAVMLTTRDTASVIGPMLEGDLLAYYIDQAQRRAGVQIAPLLDPVSFLEEYRLAVLQHALKAIGRFAQLSRLGQVRYRVYVPFCVEQARRMLASSDDFPALREALCG
jgi:aminoglycoside/choline kinase family phosphotransferase